MNWPVLLPLAASLATAVIATKTLMEDRESRRVRQITFVAKAQTAAAENELALSKRLMDMARDLRTPGRRTILTALSFGVASLANAVLVLLAA